MPTYGKKKVKDMVRSILPSKRAKGAKDDKDRIHREYRRAAKVDVHKMEVDPEEYDEYSYSDEKRSYRRDIKSVVNRRREADNIKPLMRWAPKVTKGKPDKRVAQLRAMMPKNTIGEHAIGHVKYLDQFENENERKAREGRYKYSRYKSTYRYLNDKERIAFLTKLMREYPWLHGKVNEALRNAHSTHQRVIGYEDRIDTLGRPYRVAIYEKYGPKQARYLLSANDVEKFVDDLNKATFWRGRKDDGSLHPEWLKALDAFIIKMEKEVK